MLRNNNRDNESGLSDVILILCKITNSVEMQRFLNEILTPAELKDLFLRWELMKKLSEGVSQREIARQLGVSLCKITRGAKVLKKSDSVSRKFLTEKKAL